MLLVNKTIFNSLNAELNPIYHLLALLGAHLILHVSRIRVKSSRVLVKMYLCESPNSEWSLGSVTSNPLRYSVISKVPTA
jgi:hypothetical protein